MSVAVQKNMNIIDIGRFKSLAVADLHSKILDAPPRGPKFFQFHAVFGKFWQNHMLAPPGGFGAPSRGNPGSATA